MAIASALITSTFGFASGFVGYYRRGLIDFYQARLFIIYTIPLAIIGALISAHLAADLIRFLYGLMMLILVFYFLRRRDAIKNETSNTGKIQLTSRNGVVYVYNHFIPKKLSILIGGFFTGLLSTGVGEVTMPQLVKEGKIPVPVAAATSVFIVIATFFFASITHVSHLIKHGGIEAVPWHLVCYTIPGVIIGGQIGPRLQGRFSRPSMIKGISLVFFLVGLAMIWTTLRSYME